MCPSNDGSSERLIRKKIKPEIFSLDLSLIRMNNNPCLKSEKSWDFIYFQFHFHSFEIVLVRSLVWWVERNFITVGFLGYSQVSWTLRLISKVKLLDFRAKLHLATSMHAILAKIQFHSHFLFQTLGHLPILQSKRVKIGRYLISWKWTQEFGTFTRRGSDEEENGYFRRCTLLHLSS